MALGLALAGLGLVESGECVAGASVGLLPDLPGI